MKKIYILLLGLLVACNSEESIQPEYKTLIDPEATAETMALYNNLRSLSPEHLLFGHQDDLAYGYSWWGESGRSDVMEASGSYPAVYGWDVGHIVQKQDDNLDGINFMKMRKWISEGYSRGGVITISWHMRNPATGGNSWDTVPTIASILPGAEHHDTLKSWLDIFAEFSQTLKDEDGNLIPIIFRPYHEHNGDWFWWGKRINSEEDYITLWQFTVEYLRDEKQVHNLLWAFSPDRSRTNIDTFKTDYFYGFPGVEYVDIMGLDNYWDVGHPANEASPELQQEHLVTSLTYLAQLADSLNKIPALTETGKEALPESDIWTTNYLKAFQANEWTRQISYMLVWRNANYERENRDHYYAPFEGEASATNFIEFKQTDFILLEDELPDMYSKN